MVRLLAKTGNTVIAIGRSARPERLVDMEGEVDYRSGDIRSQDFVEAALEGIDAVIHLAAAGVQWQPEESFAELVETNAVATDRLIRLAGDAGTAKVVVAGSQAEFGHRSRGVQKGYGADSAPRPINEYGVSKAAALLVAPIAGDAAGVETTGLRIFSPYGPAESSHRFIPSVILSALRLEPVLMTPGEQVRDFTHVDDVARAFITAADTPWGDHRAFNIGTGRGIRLKDAAKIVVSHIGPEVRIEAGALPYRDEEPMRLLADPSGLPPELRDCLSTTFEEGSAATVEWFRGRVEQ